MSATVCKSVYYIQCVNQFIIYFISAVLKTHKHHCRFYNIVITHLTDLLDTEDLNTLFRPDQIDFLFHGFFPLKYR